MTRSLVHAVTSSAGYVVRHPLRSAFRTVGVARGAAAAAVGVLSGRSSTSWPADPVDAGTPPDPASDPDTSPTAQAAPRPAAEQRAPADPPEAGESFAHEVSPVGHADRHGGTAPADLDDWESELDDGTEVTTSAGTTGVDLGINPDTGLPNHVPGD